MIHDSKDIPGKQSAGPGLVWLEWLTAAVLIGVVLALGWITVAPLLPEWGFLPTVEAEVLVVLALLAAALLLVSVVALWHTRS